jgi:S-adenosylmethionine synthetase
MISKSSHIFTSESVTEGHPDKMADQISDAILDAILAQDPKARVAVECLLTTGICMVAGEITSTAHVNFSDIARKKIAAIGFNSGHFGFDANTCCVLTAIQEQSRDIAMGVDAGVGKELGAGDQGMMFGYACDETPELMPLPITYAHALARRLAEVRKSGLVPFLGPDGKTQVSVRYEGGVPVGVQEILVSSQHLPNVTQGQLKEAIMEMVIKKTIPAHHLLANLRTHINPTGSFVIGGPQGDTGLTGRKIIVDTYGGMGRHGGGAFSGKDPTKVDRSAAYMARYVAKNIVAAGLAKQAEVQLSYAIGMSDPINVTVNTFGTASVDEVRIEDAVKRLAPLKPQGLIEHLNLLRPIYQGTAAYGHFGRQEPNFTWERVDLAEALKNQVL